MSPLRTTRPCEVCGDWVPHKDAVVVGRRPSGRARLVHRKKCLKKWEAIADDRRSGWVENR